MRNDEPGNAERQLERLVEAVLKSSKYRWVCEDLIRNVGGRELSKGQDVKTAIKSTKNKLHQIAGAYFLQRPAYGVWLEKLRAAKESGDAGLFREACAEIMSYHYSTRQRLSFIDQFYGKIFSLLPHPVRSIVDIACGFHPLSIPWMPLTEKVNYYACDVYEDLVGFLTGFMALTNAKGCVEARDVLLNVPRITADVAFVLNVLPCLEQVEKSASLRILESVDADFLVVSFPAYSLCGREKSMRKQYTGSFDKLIKEKDWAVQCLDFEAELVFVIHKTHWTGLIG